MSSGKNNVLKLFLFNLLAIVLLLLVVEITFRLIGFVPGLIVDQVPFEKTDSLYLYKDYAADENGILKFSQQGRQYVETGITGNLEEDGGDYILINMLIDDFIAVNTGKINNPFSKFIHQLKKQDSLGEVELAYLRYCQSPINADGFRSIEFVNYATNKTKILLLGDSHTYGAEASNITNSFADRLSAMGYVVYNTGIVATDPAQYLAVAKKYIPLLNPDIVVVNFCLNNDIVFFKREVKPYQKIFYATNVENIMACPDGVYLETPQAAYQFVLDECYIPFQKTNWFNWLSAKTVLTTKLWIVLEKVRMVENIDVKRQDYFKKTNAVQNEQTVSDFFLQKIKVLTEQHKATFILSGIPDGDNLEKRPNEIPGLFENLVYNIPEETNQNDRAAGGHFNDRGYEKYADYLHDLIDSILVNQSKAKPL